MARFPDETGKHPPRRGNAATSKNRKYYGTGRKDKKKMEKHPEGEREDYKGYND